MSLQIVFGILLIAFGSFSAGSFAVPFAKIKGWQWETYWLIFSVGGYILFPLIASAIFVPDALNAIFSTPSSVLVTVFIFGMIYGIGNLSFGLSLRYLGLSLGYALSLGLMLAIGTLIPPLIDGRLKIMIDGAGGKLLLGGVVMATVGIAFSAWSGVAKDKSLTKERKQKSISDYNFGKGILASFLVGITGSAMAFGFEHGLTIAKISESQGTNPLFSMMPVFVVLLSGTFVTTLLWCFYLGLKNKSVGEFIKKSSSGSLFRNYFFGLLAGFLWFSQFIFYSMGNSKMDSLNFISWGILMALTIMFASVWGILRGEWKGVSSRIILIMILSLLILVIASFMIGISGSI